jgi:hypothetical protein
MCPKPAQNVPENFRLNKATMPKRSCWCFLAPILLLFKRNLERRILHCQVGGGGFEPCRLAINFFITSILRAVCRDGFFKFGRCTPVFKHAFQGF